MAIKNKKILITAGPTWVPIDGVRVISNIATAQTGVLLAQKLIRMGMNVTLLLGPAQDCCCLSSRIRILPFRFFDELQHIILRELRSAKYDAVVHSAAVSDYRPVLTYKQKINSEKKDWKIHLVRTPKIIDAIKKIQKDTLLVGFKFIPQAKPGILFAASKRLLKKTGADLVIANSAGKKGYTAYILDKNTVKGPLASKETLVNQLAKIIAHDHKRA